LRRFAATLAMTGWRVAEFSYVYCCRPSQVRLGHAQRWMLGFRP
jgi:hypothetical protein